MGWQWHQLDHMQIICTSLQTDNHTSTPPLSFYRPDALPAAQPTASKHWTPMILAQSHQNKPLVNCFGRYKSLFNCLLTVPGMFSRQPHSLAQLQLVQQPVKVCRQGFKQTTVNKATDTCRRWLWTSIKAKGLTLEHLLWPAMPHTVQTTALKEVQCFCDNSRRFYDWHIIISELP